MHLGSGGGSFIAILVPRCLDFVGSHGVIFALGPILRSHHIGNDLVGIKLIEMRMIKGSDRFVSTITSNGVNMWTFIETDILVPLMRVLLF